MRYAVNVRTLAEFALEGGDLAVDSALAERMREGMEGHLTLQRQLDESWRTEEPLQIEADFGDLTLRIQGRADAVRRWAGDPILEEIKTTRRDPARIAPNDYPVHWAQAEIYAAILCRKEGFPQCEVALVYFHPSGARSRFARLYTASELWERLLEFAAPYARWLMALEAWRGKFQKTVNALPFPFDTFRDGQRQMAANAYIAVRDHRRVMIEAPTGIGKTAAALFGALKAAGEGCAPAIFYLTARTTGRRSAENALSLMRKKGLRVRGVTISAKEKACVLPGSDCSLCPRARGYFDRRRAVLVQVLEMDCLDDGAIAALAEENELCPFELSLDLAESADVIICDYNYVFDPRVRLVRFFTKKNGCAVLIDEAHNLPDRARDMLSAELDGRQIARLRREIGKGDPLYPVLTRFLQAMKAPEDAQAEALTRPPDPVAIAAEELAESLTGAIPPGHPFGKQLLRLMLDATWYVRRHGEFRPEESRALVEPRGKLMNAKLYCVDPAAHIDSCLKRVGSAVLFSATLTPQDFYAHALALHPEKGDGALTLASPFAPEHQKTLLVRLPARYAAREQSLPQLCRGLWAMMSGRVGNYLAAFPSYAYLEMAYAWFTAQYPDVRCIRQRPAMDEAARAEFIAHFQPQPQENLLAFVVLGGVFAEGVDLPGDRLIGAAIVSVGIPMLCREREALRLYADDGEDTGYDAAYVYPGFRRVLQAAGRVIRTDTDRGVVLLMDERFVDEKYVRLMPPHWNVRVMADETAVSKAVRHFWASDNVE